MKVKFYGSGDDLFCYGHETGSDEIDTYDTSSGYKITSKEGGLYVVGCYAPLTKGPGCWMVGLMPLNEDVPMPDWEMDVQNFGYSTGLTLDVPENAVIEPIAQLI